MSLEIITLNTENCAVCGRKDNIYLETEQLHERIDSLTKMGSYNVLHPDHIRRIIFNIEGILLGEEYISIDG